MMHVLARAVIVTDKHLLVARAKDSRNTFLPGGHVELGETMPKTLERELKEELGLTVHVQRYLGAVEHSYGSPEEYEINHVFAASCEHQKLAPLESKEDHLEFLWLPLDTLETHNLMPPPMIKLARDFADGKTETFWASTL
jgi:8-oxo-dGTP diphosphatase